MSYILRSYSIIESPFTKISARSSAEALFGSEPQGLRQPKSSVESQQGVRSLNVFKEIIDNPAIGI